VLGRPAAARAAPHTGPDVYMEPVWRLIETYHAVVYYAPERQQEYSAVGLRGGWMGYFASRSGALGPAGPGLVAALFYNFAEAMVARALPDAWSYCSPQDALDARLRVVDRAMRRLLGADVAHPALVRAASLARHSALACPPHGRPLFAAHRALPVPDEPHLGLFWATSALREFRGEGHNAALLHAGVDGCEAHVLMRAIGLVPDEQPDYRGWDDDKWRAAEDRLRGRGWLEPDGQALTAAGRQARAAIERDTERLAAPATAALGPAGTDELAACLSPVVDRIVTGGGVPYPNGMGVPPVQELAAGH
jgi:hypothetical protein